MTKSARRHPVLTAAAGLAAGLVLTGVWTWDRQALAASSAVRKVARQAIQLQANGRYAEALAVTERASDLLPRLYGDTALCGEISALRADLALLSRLEDIKFEAGLVISQSQHFGVFSRYKPGPDQERIRFLFRQAFLDCYSIDVLGEPEDIVKRKLGERGSEKKSLRHFISGSGLAVRWRNTNVSDG